MRIFDTFDDVSYMMPCIKRAIVVHAKQIHEKFQVLSLEGNYAQGWPGDYLMRGINGGHYICAREIFEKSYDFVEDM